MSLDQYRKDFIILPLNKVEMCVGRGVGGGSWVGY